MSNLRKAFENRKAFISFITAGDPTIEKTEEFILAMAKAGSDLIEIGIPFSDPIAGGEIIEKANLRALEAGTTTDKVFAMAKRIREKSQVPLVFLTYMNPVFVYGIDRFFKACKESGVDGIIIPDLPFEEKHEVLDAANQYEIALITIIAPASKERIQMLSQNARGFIYLMPSAGVEETAKGIETDIKLIIGSIREVSNTPIAVGIGTSSEAQASEISEIADGIITGDAIVKIIEQYGEAAGDYLFDYVSKMKTGINQ